MDENSNLNEIIKKICSINTLKEVHFYLSILEGNFLLINQTNNSIKKMIISKRKKQYLKKEEHIILKKYFQI